MEWGHHHRHWVLKSSFPAAVGMDLPLSPWDSTPAAYSDVTQASSHWPWPWTDILPLAHLWRQQLMFASQRRTEKEPLLPTRVFLGYSLCWNPLAEESEKQNLHVSSPCDSGEHRKVAAAHGRSISCRNPILCIGRGIAFHR